MKNTLLGITLTTLLMLYCFTTRSSAAETDYNIFIRPDGSIDPPTAPISRTGTVYTLTSDIYNKTIIVERDGIILDGKDHIIQGTGSQFSKGLDLSNREGVTAKSIRITGFYYAISLDSSQSNTIYGNTISSCTYAIYAKDSQYNKIYLNNFISEPNRVYGGVNTWDNGYPDGGNYWSDFYDVDSFSGPYQDVEGSDGIGDLIRDIDEDNFDNYPLMGLFSMFNVMTEEGTQCVHIVSNSDISSFAYDSVSHAISFDADGNDETTGFCRVCVPHALIKEPYTILVDNQNPLHVNDNLYDNGTHRWMYLSYEQPKHVVIRTADTVPPQISVLMPENKTYYTSSVSLSFNINEPVSWTGYSLDDGAIATITGNTTLTDLPDGHHSITVYARDTSGKLGSSAKVYFTISEPLFSHDVAVVSVDPSRTEVYEGGSVNITVVVQNNGDFTESFNVTAYADTNVIQVQTASDLLPGSQITLKFSWNTTGASLGNHTIKAEANTLPGESNTSDNIKVNSTRQVMIVNMWYFETGALRLALRQGKIPITTTPKSLAIIEKMK